MPGVPYDSSASYLRSACEASLARLGIDMIDVFQIHRPDPLTHPGEVADALIVLKEEGKIREVGVSNYSPSQLSALQAHLPLELATIQPEFSAAYLTRCSTDVLDQALELGLRPLAWSPLAGGRLATGKEIPAELIQTLDRLALREERRPLGRRARLRPGPSGVAGGHRRHPAASSGCGPRSPRSTSSSTGATSSRSSRHARAPAAMSG